MIPACDIPAIMALRDAYGLTAGEAQAVLLMSYGGIVPHARIRDVYCDRAETSPIEARQCIKRIRQKQTGLTIIMHYGIGYELAEQDILTVRRVIRKGKKKYENAA